MRILVALQEAGHIAHREDAKFWSESLMRKHNGYGRKLYNIKVVFKKTQDVTVCTMRHLALEGVQCGRHLKMVTRLEA